jgi:hypothetical protein
MQYVILLPDRSSAASGTKHTCPRVVLNASMTSCFEALAEDYLVLFPSLEGIVPITHVCMGAV